MSNLQLEQDIINNNLKGIESKLKSKDIDKAIPLLSGTTIIHYLVVNRQLNLIKKIPKDKLLIFMQKKDINGNTPIALACYYLYLEIVDFFLSIDPDSIYDRNNGIYGRIEFIRPMYYLLNLNDYVKKIIKQYRITDHMLNDYDSIMLHYVNILNYDMVQFLLEFDKSITSKFQSKSKSKSKPNPLNKLYSLSLPLNDPPFISLARGSDQLDNRYEMLEMILPYIEDINIIDKYNNNILIYAVQMQNYDFVKLILESGIDYNYFGNNNTQHPITHSLMRNDPKIIELLLDYDINLDITDSYGATPLHYAFASKIITTIKTYNFDININLKRKLLSKIKSLNHIDIDKNSVLYFVLKDQDTWKKLKDLLIMKKLKIYQKNIDNIAPIDLINKKDLDEFYNMVCQSYLNQLTKDKKWINKFDIDLHLRLKNSDIKDILKDTQISNQIIKIIKDGQSYPESDTEHHIKLIMHPKVNITLYTPMTFDSNCFIMYLLEKYPDVKIPILPDKVKKIPQMQKLINLVDYREIYNYLNTPEMIKFLKLDSIESYNMQNDIIKSLSGNYFSTRDILSNVNLYWRDSYNYFMSPFLIDSIKNTININPKTKLIIMPVQIHGSDESLIYHANFIIYDVKNKIVEIFDPNENGSKYRNHDLNNYLKLLFENNFDVKFYSSNKINPHNSFQVYDYATPYSQSYINDPAGFCLAWCIWYVEMRIINYNINPKILCQIALYKISLIPNETFKSYIRNYSEYLNEYKLSIFKKYDLDKKYWFMNNLLYTPDNVLIPFMGKFKDNLSKIIK
jgi:ankyrin repeat protein